MAGPGVRCYFRPGTAARGARKGSKRVAVADIRAAVSGGDASGTVIRFRKRHQKAHLNEDERERVRRAIYRLPAHLLRQRFSHFQRQFVFVF